MLRSSILVLVLAGCASVPVAGEANRPPVEVVGRVTNSCGSQSGESVSLRAAGELEALDVTRTDDSGAFRFKVNPPADDTASLFIEARGKKAFVRPHAAGDVRVAELTLPCDR